MYHSVPILLCMHMCMNDFFIRCTDIIPARVRQYVKQNKFELKDFGSHGSERVLVTPASSSEEVCLLHSNADCR